MHNQQALDRLLRDLQDPRSPGYRHYLSVAEFTSRFGPTAAEYAAALNFAARHGLAVRATAPNRFVLDVQAPVARIEQTFGVHLGLYRHPDGTRLFYAPDREPMADSETPLLHISGLDDFTIPAGHGVRGGVSLSAMAAPAGTGSAPNGNFTGRDIRQAYYGGTALTGAGQIVALVEYEGFNITDVANYFSSLGQTNTVPVVAISVDGTSASCTGSCDDFEAALDIEQSIAMAPGLKQVSFYIGSTPIDILNRIATDNTAKQISSSYGWGAEADVEDPVYKEFAAQGQSFVDGSGDMGYKLTQGGVWPADDANVTGVGATDLSTASAGGAWLAETGWSLSGGGPSPDGVKIPAWQKAFVNATNKAAAARRNVPDVAAEGDYDNYACYDGKCTGGNGGTSFAAPRWAGFIALVNQQAVASNKATVGFLNPTLYKLAAGAGYANDLHDIVSGNNGKYAAVKAYDLVTGLGSPRAALIGALLP
jgi:subtilase family serine protease